MAASSLHVIKLETSAKRTGIAEPLLKNARKPSQELPIRNSRYLDLNAKREYVAREMGVFPINVIVFFYVTTSKALRPSSARAANAEG
jgi:hypothetical protein